MEGINTYQWQVFSAFCVVTFVCLVQQFLVMLPLYMHQDIQSRGGAIIQATTTREGWLSSGLWLEHISEAGATLTYTAHHRGADDTQCFTLSFTTGELTRCPQ